MSEVLNNVGTEPRAKVTKMNAKELVAMIGRRGSLSYGDGMSFEVEITDMKSQYGVLRASVRPIHGNGAALVNFDRLVMQ